MWIFFLIWGIFKNPHFFPDKIFKLWPFINSRRGSVNKIVPKQGLAVLPFIGFKKQTVKPDLCIEKDVNIFFNKNKYGQTTEITPFLFLFGYFQSEIKALMSDYCWTWFLFLVFKVLNFCCATIFSCIGVMPFSLLYWCYVFFSLVLVVCPFFSCIGVMPFFLLHWCYTPFFSCIGVMPLFLLYWCYVLFSLVLVLCPFFSCIDGMPFFLLCWCYAFFSLVMVLFLFFLLYWCYILFSLVIRYDLFLLYWCYALFSLVLVLCPFFSCIGVMSLFLLYWCYAPFFSCIGVMSLFSLVLVLCPFSLVLEIET